MRRVLRHVHPLDPARVVAIEEVDALPSLAQVVHLDAGVAGAGGNDGVAAVREELQEKIMLSN